MTARIARPRTVASAGPRPSSAMASQPAQSGALRSGSPCSAVQIALAWTSGPDMSSVSDVGVGCRSWSVGAVAPTTTMRSRTIAGSNFPASTRSNGIDGIVPGGPRKSIHAPRSG